MVRVTYADRYGKELGFVDWAEGDFAIGEYNTFELKVPPHLGIAQNSYLMIDNTEFGGIVDGVETDTTADYVTVSGRTWHGILATALIKPDSGQEHYTASGDCNRVIEALISRLGLSWCMEADKADSGFSVANWKFSRISSEMNAYAGIRKMLQSVGAKLRIVYDSAKRRVVLSAVGRGEYIDDGIDGIRRDFVISVTRPTNHLHCLGTEEGVARIRLDLYADSNGNVSKRQTLFGQNHKEEVYELSASDADELEEEGTRRLMEMQEGMYNCSLLDASEGRYDIDDVVGATTSQYSVVTTVASKTAVVDRYGITYETKTALEVQQQ